VAGRKEDGLKYKILIADDNPHSIEGLRLLLKSHLDIEPIYVETAKAAVEEVKADPYGFAAVVLDYNFDVEGVTGADVAKDLIKINSKIQIIICTGSSSMTTVLESLRARVTDFIPKSNIENVLFSIRKCFPHYDQTLRCLQREKQNLVGRYAENEGALREIRMIGRSEAMRGVYETVKKSANTKATVLIRGECGTGKELIAQALHNLSERSAYNFVPINCSAIPESLLESELFGHEKGAFTGAMTRKIGKFELAHRGTIFLDEIGDMPALLQAKLLRVLQEETFYPVGSTQLKKVDVRVVAATNVDLEKAVADGRFREDLYYRLKVISVNLPALRERVEDIEPLVIHFKEKFDKGNEKRILYRTLEYLKAHRWPGNVRELENMIHGLITLGDGAEIGPDNLPSMFFQTRKDGVVQASFNYECDYPTFQKQTEEYLARAEHDFIVGKYREHKSIREAAKVLNMSSTTLHRRLKSWGYNLDNRTENEATGN
jgi:DNA-binding NtrC family response regulator